METKCCSKCNEVKPVSEFGKHKTGKFGVNSYCKLCGKAHTRNWVKNNPEKQKNSFKNWRHKKQGIYGWFDGDISLYIGQSKQLNHRMSSHKQWFNNPSLVPLQKEFYITLNKHVNASIRVIEECSPEVLLEREQYYIDTLKPLYNTYKLV